MCRKSSTICCGGRLGFAGQRWSISAQGKKPSLRRSKGDFVPANELLQALTELAHGRYENPEVALNTGMILREMLRHEPLARTLLYSDRSVSSGRRACGD